MSSLDDFLARGGRTQRIANMLNDIFARTKALEHTELTDNDLQNLGIRMSSFDADKISVAHPMGFYAPLPEEECPEIDWPGKDKHIWRWLPGLKEEPRRVDHHIQLVSSDFWYAWLEQEKDQPWVQRRCYNESPRIGSGEYPRLAPYEWQILGEVDSVNPHYPHCSFRVIHAAEPNQALRRSEVLPIAAVMKWRMRQWRYIKDHDILPILVISIFRSQARILQAHHDGKYLHISKSRFYDFTTANSPNLGFFVRWIHSKPLGDTSTPLPIEPIRLHPVTIKRIEALSGMRRNRY